MTAEEIARAVALAAVLALGVVGYVATKEDPEPSDVKPLAAELAKGSIPAATVYRVDRSDGGVVYASKYRGADAGEVVIYLDESPCAWRPRDASDCTTADGGDPGDENTMQAGEWSGPGCVRKACVVVAGEDSRP